MRVRRLSGFSVNRLIPNVLTLLALCAGMTAIRFAVSENFEAACYAIIVAGVFDGLDGRMARLLKSTSRFGAELDSLADFVSFGVAPALVLYLWTMSALHSIGWAIVLFFAICCALRLARFNTEIAAEPQPYAAGFFTDCLLDTPCNTFDGNSAEDGLGTSQSARNLHANGLDDDIAYCARTSVVSVVPRFTRMLGPAAEVALL